MITDLDKPMDSYDWTLLAWFIGMVVLITLGFVFIK